MATLATNDTKKSKSSKRPQKGMRKVSSVSEYHAKERKKLEKKLEKEFSRVRFHFEDVRQAFKYADDAGADEDIYFRLLQLERAARRVRKGGVISRGAKLHRKLLGKLRQFPIE